MTRPFAAWERFWFAPTETSTLAVVRIWFGAVMVAWTLALTPDLEPFFSTGGLWPAQAHEPGVWGVLGWAPQGGWVILLYLAVLVASLGLMVGWQTRAATAIVFIGLMSFERRQPWVFNAGDALLRVTALYLLLAPAGTALSLDRWRTARDRFWEFPLRAPWALRLMQVQLSIIYVSGVWDKVQGSTWNQGTAVSYALRISDVAALPVPSFLTHSVLIANVLTYGTLVTELSLGILIWNRTLRPYVIAVGIAFHLSILYSIRVGFFTFAMVSLYLAFVDPGWAARQLLALRDRLTRNGLLSRLPAPAAAAETASPAAR